MCTVEKLLIKGVRSFAPDNQNVIEFYRPLTLIVGSNGAGKTTIIECLKQACTGELPPNTRSGQSFVHDPKVAGETEVRAQIKLRFRTATGAPVVVCRSFQLSQKKNALQFKTLDSVLQTYNRATGAKEAATMRCADLDRMVPSMMGVSKAVLENVIFVHQEDSNWPLAEGKVLKAKFDDIFAATKYTKALEALRKLKADKLAAYKEVKARCETLAAHKDAAHKLRATIAKGGADVAKAEAEIAELQSQIDALQAQMADADGRLERIAALGEAQAKVDAQLSVVQRQAAEQLARLATDFEETTEELEAWLARYDTEARARQAEAADLQRKAAGKRLEAEALKEQYSKACKRHGRLAAEAEAHASNARARDALVRDLSARLGVPLLAHHGSASGALSMATTTMSGAAAASLGSESGTAGGAGASAPPLLPPSVVEAFAAALSAHCADLQRQLAEAQASNRRHDEALTAAVDKANAALSRAAEAKRMKQEQLQQLQRTADALAAEVGACAVDDAALHDLAGQLEAAQAALASKTRDVEQARYDEQLAAARNELDALGRRMVELRAERDRVSAVGDAAATLRLKRQELAAKRQELDALLAAKRAPLLQLLGAAQLPEVKDIRAAADGAVARRRGALEALRARQQQVEGRKRAAAAELADKSRELGRLKLSVDALSDDLRAGLAAATLLPDDARLVDAFEPALVAIDKVKDDAAHRALTHHTQREAMRAYVDDAREKHCCPLCERDFGSEAELRAFIDGLNNEIAQDVANSGPEQRSAAAKAQAAALHALRPKAERRAQQVAAITELRPRIADLQAAHDAAESEAAALAEEEAVAAAELDSAARLAADCGWQASALDRAIAELSTQVTALEQRAAAAAAAGGPGGARTVADVDAELGALEEKRGHGEVAREALLRRQGKARDEVTALKMQVAELGQELTRQQGRAKRRADLQRQLDAAAQQQADCAAAIDAAGREAAPLAAARDAAVEQRAAARAAAAQREAAVDQRVREAQAARDQLAERGRPLAEYAAAGGGADLARVAADVDATNRRIEAAHAEVTELERELAAKQAAVGELGGTQRDIVAALDARRTAERQKALEAQLAKLEADKRGVGAHAELARAYTALQRDRDKLRSRQDRARGRLEAGRLALRAAEADLAAPQYAGIDAKHRALMVEVSTTRLAADDLDKYHRALERALLAFHASKMADINRTVKELWQRTYRGQDIDYIQIKADADGARLYNYRVVMYSGGAELDMRGRCSAGQKVLASLIIRLALAETFCLNCGILALDEPTTNLDAANAAALAEALRSVMAARRAQENFQLIVITHDEAFAAQIGTRQHADYLWRVTKDEAQHSHVAQEDIAN